MRVEQRVERAAPEIVAWRRRQLIAAGFRPKLAAGVARDGALDLHALIELVEHGCPPELAVRILAPLEEDPPGVSA
jgi:hypothetical protein